MYITILNYRSLTEIILSNTFNNEDTLKESAMYLPEYPDCKRDLLEIFRKVLNLTV